MATTAGRNSRGGVNKVSSRERRKGGSSGGSKVNKLANQLEGLTKTAKGLGINTGRSDAMVAQTREQGSRAYKGSSYDNGQQDISPVITSDALKQNAKITLPTPAPVAPAPDIAANFAGLTNSELGVTTDGSRLAVDTTDKYAGVQSVQDTFRAEMDKLNPPSAADIQLKLEKETKFRQKQQEVNNYSSQLNTIVANRDANILRTEGQGRGIPEAIIGGQQAQINREAAIQALPVQAQLAAAQGNLELAQDHINTWGRILMDDATNKYNQKKELLTSVRDFAVGIEFKRIDDLNAANERKYQETRSLTQAKTAALSNALGQGAPSSIVNAIKMATTPEEVAAAAGIYNGDILARQAQQLQIQKLQKELTPDEANSALGQAIAGEKVDNINNILNSKALDSAVGPSGLARTQPGLWGAAKRFFSGFFTGAATTGVAALPTGIAAVPAAIIGGLTVGVVNALRGTKDELTGDRQSFIGSVEQMRAELTKEKLAQAKGQGVTFGALSDGERVLIANAATKLGTWAQHEDGDTTKQVIGYNIDEKSFKKEMDVINYFTKLDALLQGADPDAIGVSTQSDGTYWILNSDGTYSQLLTR